jgi:hypothetical protein
MRNKTRNKETKQTKNNPLIEDTRREDESREGTRNRDIPRDPKCKDNPRDPRCKDNTQEPKWADNSQDTKEEEDTSEEKNG